MIRRGEVWWATLPEPWGRRPVLLVARDEAYSLLNWVTVALLTSRTRDNPSMVMLMPASDGAPQPCVVNLDASQMVHVGRIDTFLVRLRAEKMEAVDRAIHFALGLRQ